MTIASSLRLRLPALLSAAALFTLASLPALLHPGIANAAQLTQRSVTMSTSKVSATGATYNVSFKAAQTTNIEGIVVQFCSNSPLIGLSCTAVGNGFAFTDSGSVTVNYNNGSSMSFSHAANSDTGDKVIISDSTGFTPTTSDAITFTISGVTNPSTTGTFYARILTYTLDTAANSYVAATPGTHIDDGGVALSTAAQLTINARVQEQLTFCVGTTSVNNDTSSVGANCAAVSGTNVDLGPIGTSTSISPVATASGGNNLNGVAMVQTNAFNGVIVTYFAEQAGTGTNHLGALRVTGATCTADAFPSTSNTDQCFNSAGTTQGTFGAGTEKFGFTIGAINCASVVAYTCNFTGGTYNLVRDGEYNGDGANTVGTSQGFAFDDTGTIDQIASSASSSSKVVDNEALILNFAARAAITTPTGSYGTTTTYIATATF